MRMLSERLTREWSPRNTCDPESVSSMSNKKFFWKCEKGHEWIAVVSDRSRGTGCPVCSNRRLLTGFNDLRSRYPDIAAEWNDARNDRGSDEVVFGSTYKAWWICPRHHEWKMSVVRRTTRHLSCPFCSGQELLKGFNDLRTRRPDLASQWSDRNEKKPDEVTSGSSLKAFWKCEKGHEWRSSICSRNFYNTECPECASKKFSSGPEKEVLEYVRSILDDDCEIVSDTRSVIPPHELDIYIPSRRTAIEFNGIYWHSEQAGKDRNYHYDKWKSCQDIGVHLITVWEDDWRDGRPIVESLIAHKLGVSADVRVPARSTSFRKVDIPTAREFLDGTHIQGFREMCTNFGLFVKDSVRPVAVMSVSRNGETLTIERYSTSCTVQGGFTKLLTHVLQSGDYKGSIRNVITFSDNMVSDGGLYRNNGFIVDRILRPDYSYVHKDHRYHKFVFRKSRFRNDKFLKFQEGLTEKELADLNGLRRVWDAGKVRWRLPVVA